MTNVTIAQRILWAFTLTLSTTLSLALLSSCGSKDADKVGDAQICLDGATAATAAACMEKIDGITSKAAYSLRCAAGFISEGFATPDKYISAYTQLSSTPTGCSGNCSSTLGLMSLLTFSSIDSASTTYDNCFQSGSQGYLLLASTVKSATILAKIATTCLSVTGTPTAANLESAAAALASESCTAVAASPSTIGSLALTTYQVSCTTGNQSASNQQLCTELSTAITAGGSDPATVGASLLSAWQN